MKPIEFEGQTTLLAPPESMERGTCGALPVYIDRKVGQPPVFASYWKPDAEDLAKLNRGEYVQLAIFGPVHPPVWLTVLPAKELP